ncbi:uncharacterized protein C594.04c-like [Bradysia coprophila]|uniref:uncharacterized protein C594.04c-like n=1 Tax=Bradysia coprophila TaxID=38358 RepID=UPI00187D7FC9|nr:uncharacterized protein C594.04c-like [Bradysia coprophila]
MSEEFTKLLLWDTFYDTIGSLKLPHVNTFYKDLALFHEQADTLVYALVVGLFFAVVSWVLSLITGLHTWVDKWWSILPVIVALHFSTHDCLYQSSGDHPLNSRLWLVTLLICLWGARLTYNFNRKGGYSNGFVDYRWTYLQIRVPSKAFFFIFNIVFICLYQNVLLVLLAVPLYVIEQAAHLKPVPLNWIDAVATAGFIGCLVVETVADNQQWAFYEQRRKAIESKKKVTGDLKRGFLSHGLFRYSRHPNFFGEMGIWWFVYLYSVAATYPVHVQWINPTIIGTILLTLLFQGSTALTEFLSSSKYPAYKQYQRTTSRFIPLFAGQPLD